MKVDRSNTDAVLTHIVERMVSLEMKIRRGSPKCSQYGYCEAQDKDEGRGCPSWALAPVASAPELFGCYRDLELTEQFAWDQLPT